MAAEARWVHNHWRMCKSSKTMRAGCSPDCRRRYQWSINTCRRKRRSWDKNSRKWVWPTRLRTSPKLSAGFRLMRRPILSCRLRPQRRNRYSRGSTSKRLTKRSRRATRTGRVRSRMITWRQMLAIPWCSESIFVRWRRRRKALSSTRYASQSRGFKPTTKSSIYWYRLRATHKRVIRNWRFRCWKTQEWSWIGARLVINISSSSLKSRMPSRL